MFDDVADRALMARIVQGDTAAFERLYANYEKPVGAFLFRMTYDRTLSEDCLQEVFMRVWKAAPTWRGDCRVSTFIFQVAKNYALNARDKVRREQARTGDGSREAEEGSCATSEPAAAADAAPSHALEGAELRQAVRDALEALPEEQRVIMLLAQTDGLTYREIADILQMPLGTVKSRMAAASDALRRRLERHIKE